MNNTSKIIAIVVVVVLGAFITFQLAANKQEINEKAEQAGQKITLTVPVRVASVQPMSLDETAMHTGEFEGWEETSLIAEAQGTIRYIKVEEGDAVKKGDIIAKVDATSINSQLATAEASLKKAQKDFERYQRLEKAGAVSELQKEEAQLAVENAKANVASARQQLGFTTVYAPISGFVDQVNVEDGSFVMPGNQIASIIQVDRLKMIIKVSEDELSSISVGQRVSVATDVYATENFDGEVINISYKADPSKKFRVTVEVDNNREIRLRAGMFGEVKFSSEESSAPVLAIPRQALVGSMLDASVYLVEDNHAVKKSITAGSRVGNNVSVLAGLEEGEQVITSGQINLEDGDEIKVVE
ncbi:MAG: efflux RND transporter periplasmic adaptor subunit [Cyclobacteriaceae bacterium]